jgi:ribosomal 50S subunit-associated protein YjgA (DUF615 family)
VGAITALLGIAEQFLGLQKVKELKEFVSKWVDTQKAIQEEMSHWPDVDTVKLGQLWKDLALYEEAANKQASLLTAAHV